MNDDNLPNVNVNADLSKTIEKAYDDTLQKPLDSTSSIVSTVLDFFHNTVLYPMQKYNLYAKSKLDSYALELQERAKKIPEKNLVSPRVNILGPTIEGLKYNLDEDYIKEMFTNILISDMDSTKQSKVLPSYIEVVKQLSHDDAIFLNNLKRKKLIDKLPIIRLKMVTNGTSYFSYISNYYICSNNGDYIEIPHIVLDNLIRLQIVEIPFDEYIVNPDAYQNTFDKLKNTYFIMFNSIPNNHLDCQKRKLEFTSFGKNFIDICLS